MITTLTEEVLERQRKGINFYTIPGHIKSLRRSNMYDETVIDPPGPKKQTLEMAIRWAFGVNKKASFKERTRKREIAEGRHFYHYCLERMSKDGKILQCKRPISRPRIDCFNPFMFSLHQIEEKTTFDHATILHSSKVCANLMLTDHEYRSKCEIVLKKIERGLIIIP
jgi:hypothetical protein